MAGNILLSIDYSTSCTGYALFDCDKKQLIDKGFIKAKNFKDTSSIRGTLRRLIFMANEIKTLIDNLKPSRIVIEEIAGSASRLSQKVLDAGHGVLWFVIVDYLDLVDYYDVTGSDGWRTHLGLKLSDADKINNKEAKAYNKKKVRGTTDMPVVGPKHLACRHANYLYKLNLDCDENTSDGDVADAICMGHSYMVNILPKMK